MICIRCKREVVDAPFCCQCGAKQERTRSAARRSNGTGNAYKRGRTWTGRAPGYSYTEVAADGTLRTVRRRPTKGGFKTKTDALTWANGYGKSTTASTPTLAELWSGYSTGELTKLSKDKISAYKKAHNRLEPIMGRKIETLSIKDLQDVIDSRAATHYTARDMKTVLSKLYQRAMAERKAEVNLAQFLVLPDLEEKEAEPFTAAEVSALWNAYNNGDAFVGYILLMIYTGMMPAELMACRKNMIDFDKCEIWGCGKKTTKRKKEIPIVFPEFLEPVLRHLMTLDSDNSRADHEKLLQMNKDAFYLAYHAATARAGVRDLPPYSCRHTYGTRAVEGQNSPEVVRQMLRHATIYMQQRYTHLSPTAAHEAANALTK